MTNNIESDFLKILGFENIKSSAMEEYSRIRDLDIEYKKGYYKACEDIINHLHTLKQKIAYDQRMLIKDFIMSFKP